MLSINKTGLLISLCALLISCSEFQFLQQPSVAETGTSGPDPVEPAAEAQPQQPGSASEYPVAEVRIIPVGSRETFVRSAGPARAERQDGPASGAHLSGNDSQPEPSIDRTQLVGKLCNQIGNKLTSVSVHECDTHNLVHSGYSVQGRSLAYRDYPPLSSIEAPGRVMVIGGIHGDEFSSVSVVFKWMNFLKQSHAGQFHWRFIPSANPDGLLIADSQRQNANGIDLNRNFPTADWDRLAHEYWVEDTYRNSRRYPGANAMSEPETKFLVEQIREFNPDIIISMHAPYHLLDYQGPPSAPDKLGGLYLRELDAYPGSLGSYFGVDLAKPIVTMELKSAGIMPSDQEIGQMWTDLQSWLQEQLVNEGQVKLN